MGSADGPVSSPGRGRPPGDETCGRRKPASAGTEACNCLLPEVALTAPSLQTWRWKGKGNHCDPGGRVRPRWQELAWSELRVHSGEGSGELSARSQVRVPLGALLLPPSRGLGSHAVPSRESRAFSPRAAGRGGHRGSAGCRGAGRAGHSVAICARRETPFPVRAARRARSSGQPALPGRTCRGRPAAPRPAPPAPDAAPARPAGRPISHSAGKAPGRALCRRAPAASLALITLSRLTARAGARGPHKGSGNRPRPRPLNGAGSGGPPPPAPALSLGYNVFSFVRVGGRERGQGRGRSSWAVTRLV